MFWEVFLAVLLALIVAKYAQEIFEIFFVLLVIAAKIALGILGCAFFYFVLFQPKETKEFITEILSKIPYIETISVVIIWCFISHILYILNKNTIRLSKKIISRLGMKKFLFWLIKDKSFLFTNILIFTLWIILTITFFTNFGA